LIFRYVICYKVINIVKIFLGICALRQTSAERYSLYFGGDGSGEGGNGLVA